MSTPPLSHAVRVDPQPEAAPPAFELIDDVQGVSVQLLTNQIIHPTQCSPAQFLFPVDVAYELSPCVLRTHLLNPVIVRDVDGNVCAEITNQTSRSLPLGEYTVDLCSLGMKVYLDVEGELQISYDGDKRMIDCSGATSVRLGVRSFHDAPSATVTTSDQPRDIMRAISCLGSSLKTTTCERSFPTLRGHPPLFERGECFHAPSNLERTEETASVRIEVPPTLDSIYPVAPLAYYLNAVVRPGDEPQIVTDETTVVLDRGNGVEQGVAQLLKHVFTLDCITRTEGLYPITLSERATLEDRLMNAGIEIDFTTLYDRSLAEQLQRYVSIPFDLVADLVPRWPLTADVHPVQKYLPHLPFVVASLGTVRCLPLNSTRSPPSNSPSIQAFCRSATATDCDSTGTLMRAGSSIRSPDDAVESHHSPDVHTPPKTDSIAQLWLADGYPMQGAKPTVDAFKRRLDAVPGDSIDVAVISNDTAMEAESDVADLYSQRGRVAFDVTMYEELSTQGLATVFAEEYDFVHYVGHVDSRGLQCADGWLDAHTLDTVNARAFILNGCRSYEQGTALVETGAIGGLCTLSNVGNTPATRIGRTVARLLNAGFSLAGALELISEDFVTGQQYVIVGDPTLSIVKSHGDTPTLAEITPTAGDDTFVVDLHGYLSDQTPLGMPLIPSVSNNERYYLNSGHLATFNVSRTALTEYLSQEQFPVRIDGTVRWSNAISLDSMADQ